MHFLKFRLIAACTTGSVVGNLQMIGLGLAFLAGLVPALLWKTENVFLVIAGVVGGIFLLVWGRMSIAWDMYYTVPWLSTNSWGVAIVLAVLGAGITFFEGRVIRKFLIPGALIALLLWGFNKLNTSGDPTLEDLSVAIPIQAAIVLGGIWVLVSYIPNRMKKKKAAAAAKEKKDH